ncbi:MAG TPA: non-canonical purine NTP pyrophosphatase [Gaiellaceae bacterium]|nr:non-canonical purine NTP pyrophosphatase [Gaiellaceae bacterium]
MAELSAVLASGNEHKARELERLLPGWRIEALLGADFPEETGETYWENALGKARFGRTLVTAEAWVLGDDSGIEVEALGWKPGVHTARWAAGDHVGRLLAALAGEERRRARYVCELAAIGPDGRELRATGTLAGRIAHEPAGAEGFGFDPIFVPEGEERTVAQLGDAWKDAHSHRAEAARVLLNSL